MAFEVLRFHLAGNQDLQDTGNRDRATLNYRLRCNDPNPTLLWNWLTHSGVPPTTIGGLPQEGVEYPDGNFYIADPIPEFWDFGNGRYFRLTDVNYVMGQRARNPVEYVITATWQPLQLAVPIKDAQLSTNELSVGFEIGADNETIYTSLQRLKVYSTAVPHSLGPDGNVLIIPFDGINEQMDGTVKGVRPPAPRQTLTFNLQSNNGAFTPAYARRIARIAGHVSDTTFPSFWPVADRLPVGEVRFMGASGNVDLTIASITSRLTLKFGVRQNVSGDSVDGIVGDKYWAPTASSWDTVQTFNEPTGGITYEGWDYAWMSWLRSNTERRQRMKHQLNVDRIFRRTNLNTVFAV